jgi:hypothetical protein
LKTIRILRKSISIIFAQQVRFSTSESITRRTYTRLWQNSNIQVLWEKKTRNLKCHGMTFQVKVNSWIIGDWSLGSYYVLAYFGHYTEAIAFKKQILSHSNIHDKSLKLFQKKNYKTISFQCTLTTIQ